MTHRRRGGLLGGVELGRSASSAKSRAAAATPHHCSCSSGEDEVLQKWLGHYCHRPTGVCSPLPSSSGWYCTCLQPGAAGPSAGPPPGAPRQLRQIAAPLLGPSSARGSSRCASRAAPALQPAPAGPQQRLRWVAGMGARRRQTTRRGCHGMSRRLAPELRRPGQSRRSPRAAMSCSQLLRAPAAAAPAGRLWLARARDPPRIAAEGRHRCAIARMARRESRLGRTGKRKRSAGPRRLV